MNIFEKIAYYLRFPFMQNALVVSILISLCASLLGVTLVLKRYSYIGDGLSHIAFGALAVAAVCNISNNMILTLPITILCSVLILCGGQKLKIKGDAIIAIISVSALAIGYLLMSVFNTSPNVAGDVCSSLFGSESIYSLTSTEVWISVALSVVVVAIFVIFYHKIFAVTFDETFAKATGTKTFVYNIIIAIVISVVIVLAMRLAGSLLVSALIIFPALTSMRVFKSYLSVTISSVSVSVVCAIFGIFAAILLDTPVGATIVAINLLAFLIFGFIGLCLNGKRT